MRLTVGILTYNSEQVAFRSLETAVAQTGLGELLHENPSGGAMKRAHEVSSASWQVVCLDNASNDRIALIRLEKRFPQVRFLREEKNRGFAQGHNTIMRAFPAEFHAVLNCDVLLAPDFLATLLHALEEQPRYGSAVGKLLQWNISNEEEKTNIIDSVGIGVTKSHAFHDIGQGEVDKGQYDAQADRFGGTGAAVVYRHSTLEDVAYQSTVKGQSSNVKDEFFDETIFLYKEDVDLAYRLLVTGHPCLYVPGALAWHARTVGIAHKRRHRPSQTHAWSAAHESLLLRKHERFWPLGVQLRTLCRQASKWLYLLTLEPRVFSTARKILKVLTLEAEKRRRATKHTVPFERVAHFFS